MPPIAVQAGAQLSLSHRRLGQSRVSVMTVNVSEVAKVRESKGTTRQFQKGPAGMERGQYPKPRQNTCRTNSPDFPRLGLGPSCFVLRAVAECGKSDGRKTLWPIWKSGAGDGIRTHDPNLGKVVLGNGRNGLEVLAAPSGASGRDTDGTPSGIGKGKHLISLALPRGLEPLFSP
jgi:hypothetical protein